MSPKDFYRKKVLILGLGLHGGGVAAAYWFFRHGSEVIVTDIKSRTELASSLAQLTTLCNEYRLSHPGKRFISIEYVLGHHREEDVLRADYVIQNPGVPYDSPILVRARKERVPVHNDASIFFSLVGASATIGVTGTRGKTTTTCLIGEMLKEKFPQSIVAGIATPSGAVSLFSILDKVYEFRQKGMNDPVVLELSSWQLEVVGAHALSPQYAVVTTIRRDHLNRYPSMDDYIEAKKNICRYLSAQGGGAVILNADDEVQKKFAEHLPPEQRYWYSRAGAPIAHGCSLVREAGRRTYAVVWKKPGAPDQKLCDVSHALLKGAHNQENILAALTVGMILDIPVAAMCGVISTWAGVPGRLQYIGDVEGRRWYNDTTATSPDATIAALTTLSKRAKKIILLAGGSDKNLAFEELGVSIAKKVKAVVVFSGTASPALVSAAAAAGYSGSLDYANSMHEAVRKAWKRSQRGDILLLSPAAASFGLFQHEFDRGDQFVKAFQLLQGY